MRLMIQSDNTVKEIRNQFSARVLCALCQSNVVDVATEAHLPVGHTSRIRQNARQIGIRRVVPIFTLRGQVKVVQAEPKLLKVGRGDQG